MSELVLVTLGGMTLFLIIVSGFLSVIGNVIDDVKNSLAVYDEVFTSKDVFVGSEDWWNEAPPGGWLTPKEKKEGK